jgi:hypothetical protein
MSTREAAAIILRAGLGVMANELAELTGYSGTFVLSVRTGKTCRDVLPSYPRYTMKELSRTCRDCENWNEKAMNPCTLGFPEVERKLRPDGKLERPSATFARVCSAFMEKDPGE